MKTVSESFNSRASDCILDVSMALPSVKTAS